jgi:hypothetical protein
VGLERLPEGTRVQVRDSCGKVHQGTVMGTVMATYCSPGRTAVHVRLDDGRWQLLWAEDLEKESSQ